MGHYIKSNWRARFILISCTSLFVIQTPLVPQCASYKRTEFCEPLYSFMEAIMRITDLPDKAQRMAEYKSKQQALIDAAKKYFGPSWDPSQFIFDMHAFVNHQEIYRRPPAGWDYNPYQDLSMFNSIGKDGFSVYERLSRWCWALD